MRPVGNSGRVPLFACTRSPIPWRRVHILLLEDDTATADALRVGLERSGFTVTWVATCADALGRIATNRFAAVVLDVMVPTGNVNVPTGDGYDVLKGRWRQ